MDQQKKGFNSVVFYVLLILFIVLAYLYNNGTLTSLFPKSKTALTEKRNIIDLEFKEKEYNVNFTKAYAGNGLEIADFEEGEKWNGDFNIDDSNFMEGKTAFSLASKNSSSSVIYLNKKMDLSKFEVFKMLIYSAKENDLDNIQKLNLRFGNKNDTLYYEYSIRNIKEGWNIITMEKKNFAYSQVAAKKATDEKTDEETVKTVSSEDTLWSNIESATLELTSRPANRVELTFDRLWAEKDESYQEEDFRTDSPNTLSLKNYNNLTFLNVWRFDKNLALLKKVTGVKNFTYTAKIIPQLVGTFGINARTDISNTYGYYLELSGIGSGAWQLYKIGKPVEGIGSTFRLDNGEIANFLLEENKPVWLRLKLSGNIIIVYLSINGKDFTRLAEKSDPELKSGGIGLQTGGGSFLVESVEFLQ